MQNAELRINSSRARNFSLDFMKKSIIEEKSFKFAIRIVRLYQYLVNEKKEYVMSRQLLKSGTSIGANTSEAQRGQSNLDFYSKIAIALKEANETYYWIRLLFATDYLSEKEYLSLSADVNELISILVAISKSKDKKQI